MTRIFKPEKGKPSRKLAGIYGDCLEGVGLIMPNRGKAIIDCSITPRVGDLVHCDKNIDTICGYIKQVKEINGDTIIVGTKYLDESRDYTFKAGFIYGVVTEVFDAATGRQIYKRPTKRKEK